MTETKMPWVKLYTETIDDVKVGRLTDAQKWRFISLILLAGECDAAGTLVTGDSPMTPSDIAWRLRCDTQTLDIDLQRLIEVGLVTIENDTVTVAKFAERQGPTQEEKRKQWRERQNRRRERAVKPIVTSDSRVTPANVTPIEKEKEEEKDIEEITQNVINQPSLQLFGQLFDAFEEESGIDRTMFDEKAAADVIRKWVKAGVTVGDVRQAIREQRETEYAIVRPASITNAINIVRSKSKKTNNLGGYTHA